MAMDKMVRSIVFVRFDGSLRAGLGAAIAGRQPTESRIDRAGLSAIRVKKATCAANFFSNHCPDHGVGCEKCSRARTTPIRTSTLIRNPTTKQKPAAYRIERSLRSKIPGGLSLCIFKDELHDGTAQEDTRTAAGPR